MKHMHFLPLAFLKKGFIKKDPATLYILVKWIAHIFKLLLTLHPSLTPGLRYVRSRDPEHHKYDNVPPEVALMASIIIVLKITYKLDGKLRYWQV